MENAAPLARISSPVFSDAGKIRTVPYLPLLVSAQGSDSGRVWLRKPGGVASRRG